MPKPGETASAAQDVTRLQGRLRELEAEQAVLRAELEQAGIPCWPENPARSGAPATKNYKQVAEILDISADAIISVDDRGMVQRFNRGAEEIFGYRSSEIIGRPLDILIPERFRHGHRAHIAKFGQATESSRLMNERGEIHGLRRDGQEFPAEASIARLFGSGGRPIYTVTLRDITERIEAERALREREAQLRQAQTMSRIGAFVWDDLADRCLYCSDEMAALFGLTPLDFMAQRGTGETFLAFILRDDRERFLEVIETAKTKQQPYDIEYRCRDSEGNVLFFREIGEPENDETGKQVRTFGTMQDITSIRETEEALRQSEQQLRLIADNLPALIAYTDRDQQMQFANRTATEWYGKSVEDMMGRSALDIVNEELYAKLKPRFEAVLAGQSTRFEEYRDYPDGKTRYIDAANIPDIDENGEVRGFFSLVQDITERKNAEEALRHSEEQLRTITDNLPASIGYVDRHQRFRFINRVGEEWYGRAAQDIIGAHVSDILDPVYYQRILPYIEDVLAGKGCQFEERMQFPDGKMRDVEGVYVPHIEDSGMVRGWFALVQDVTDRRDAERALRESEEQFRDLIEGSIQGIVIHRDFEILFMNDAWAQIFGYKSVDDALTAGSVLGFMAPSERVRMEGIKDARMRGDPNVPARYEFKGVRKDGSHVWVENMGRLVTWKGKPALLATIVDISERKAAEEALQRSEEQLRTIANNLPAFIAYADKDERYVYVNRVLEAWYGLPASEIVGKTVREVVGDEEYEKLRPGLEKIRSGESIRFETTRVFGDGITRAVDIQYVPQLDESGGLLGWFALIQDITENREAAEALRRSEEQLRTVTDNVPAFIAYSDADERYRFVNKTVEQWYGLPASEILGRKLSDVVGPEVYAVLEPNLKKVAAGETVNFEVTRNFAGEFPRIVDVSYVPDIDSNGAVRGWFAMLSDVTESRTAERALRDSEEQLRTVTGNIPAFVTYQDRELKFRFVNKTAEHWYGQPADEMIGRAPTQFLERETRKILQEKIDRVFAGESVRFEMTRLFPDGVERWIDASYAPHFDESGEVRGFFALILDISQRRKAEEALRNREEQLRTITENIPAFVINIDKNLRIRFANRMAEEWYGLPTSKIVGKKIDQLIDAESVEIMKPHIEAVLAGRNARFEITRRFPDGGERTTDISYAPHFDGNGGVQGFFALILDITERRQAEDALRRTMKSGEMLRQIATAANDAVDAEGAMSVCLKAFCRFGGWAVGNVYVAVDDDGGPLAPAGLWWSEEGEDFAELIRVTEETEFSRGEGLPGRVAESGQPVWILDVTKDDNFPRNRKSTALGVCSGFAFPVMVGRNVAAVLEFFSRETRPVDRNLIDIAVQAGTIIGRVIERQRAARKLAERERQIRLITDNLPVLITYVGPDWRYRFVNKATEQWYGAPADDIIGHKIEEFFNPAMFEKFRPHIEVAMSGEVVRFDETITYRDGSQRNIEGAYLPHFDESGECRGFFALIADATARVKAEEERRQSQKLEAVGQLTGGVAHDFNNLLAVILGNAELLRETPDDPNEAVDAITRAARRGSDLTQRLLSFSRLQPLRPQAFDLPDLVNDMARVLSRTLGARIKVETKSAKTVSLAYADRNQLESAILNLAVNAQQAMPDGGTLTLDVRNTRVMKADAETNQNAIPGNYVRLSVSDTGSGMTEEVAAQAFEPFFTTKGVGEGSGLGLSMVYGFASQSRGFATIDSTPGKGTVVSLYLPRATAAKIAERVERPVCKSEQPDGAIMVVEDDPDVRKLTVTLLSSLGYSVLQAEDGESAATILESDAKIDLLLSDVVLPGDLSGPAIAEKALKLRPDLKVLFMSGYAEDVIERDRNGGKKSIDADLLAKPFTRNQLADKVKASLEAANVQRT